MDFILPIFKLRYITAWIIFGFLLPHTEAFADPIDDLKPGHWYEAANSRLDALDPQDDPVLNANYPREASWRAVEGVSAVIDDWNGGAFATGYGDAGGLVVFGGGHNGYFGNEVYVFDVAQLKWIRVSDPVADPVCDQSTGELQDGSPCSRHTYDYVDYHPTTNTFVSLGSASNHEVGGGGNTRVHLFFFGKPKWVDDSGDTTLVRSYTDPSSEYNPFVFEALTWRAGGVSTAKPQSQTGASSAYDAKRDVFWMLPAYNREFAMYDPNADQGEGRWITYHTHNISIDAVSAIDPTRDILVTLDNRSQNEVFVHDLTLPDQEGVAVNVTGDIFRNSQAGFEWDPIRSEFVAWDGGAVVHVLRPPTGNWRTEPWRWRIEHPVADNTVVPTPANNNGTYSRFQYVPSKDVFVVVNSTAENVFFYRRSGFSGSPTIPSAPTNLRIR